MGDSEFGQYLGWAQTESPKKRHAPELKGNSGSYGMYSESPREPQNNYKKDYNPKYQRGGAPHYAKTPNPYNSKTQGHWGVQNAPQTCNSKAAHNEWQASSQWPGSSSQNYTPNGQKVNSSRMNH